MQKVQTYLERLKAHAEALHNKSQLKNEATKDKKRRFTPLVEQITQLMKSMPPSMLNRPWSMGEIIIRLDGKYRARPHAKQVAEALKILNWQRVRRWRDGLNGLRLWLPPNS